MRDFSGLAQPEIFTLHELVHRLTLRAGIDASQRSAAQITISVQDAIRGLPGKNDWSYYRRLARLTSSESMTAPVEYDHTGGANERQVTLTGADTWPADVEYGVVRIDTTTYRVQQRVSDTVITLAQGYSLQEDYTGDITWQRNSYGFSREVTRTHYARNLTSNCLLTYAPPTTFDQYAGSVVYGSPRIFTWKSGGRFGSTDFVLHPYPTAGDQYEISATVNPIIPKVLLVSAPDGTTTTGSTTLVSPTAAFTSELVGTIIRLTGSFVEPTFFNSSSYTSQAFVVSVESATQLTMSDAATATGTFGYAISSPIDIEAPVMLEYLEDECYSQYTKNHKHESVAQARAIARESLLMAVARDNKASMNGNLWFDDHGYLGSYFYDIAND